MILIIAATILTTPPATEYNVKVSDQEACALGSRAACVALDHNGKLDSIGSTKRGWGTLLVGTGALLAGLGYSLATAEPSWLLDDDANRKLAAMAIIQTVAFLGGGTWLLVSGYSELKDARALTTKVSIVPALVPAVQGGSTSLGLVATFRF